MLDYFLKSDISSAYGHFVKKTCREIIQNEYL